MKKNFARAACVSALASTLAACGGGGERVAVTPPPVSSPTPTPAPTNTSISDLVASQTFTGSGTTVDIALTLPTGEVKSASGDREPASLAYNAETDTYKVTLGDRSSDFTAADKLPQRFSGEVRYETSSNDYLTLVTTPYYQGKPNQYVGLGYWQANQLSADTQNTSFSTFVYGFNTPAGDVPRTGSAHWLVDIFGLLAEEGKELTVIQGLGDFDVDFAVGSYRLQSFVDEQAVVTNDGVSGSLILQSGGKLGSDGSFGGILTYNGSGDLLVGDLNGSFFGPNGAEVGATFLAAGNGAYLNGGFTGQRSELGATSAGLSNLTLSDLVAEQRLFGSYKSILWVVSDGIVGYQSVVEGSSGGSVDVEPGQIRNINVQGGYTVDPSDIVNDGRSNFTTYQTTLGSDPVTIAAYKIGDTNSELQLTYTSFAEWRTSTPSPLPDGTQGTQFTNRYLVYGVETPLGLLSARTGQASYSGVAYGTGVSPSGLYYEVSGNSHFLVDFSSSRYSGSLELNGTSSSGDLRDFGTWNFANALSGGVFVASNLTGPGTHDQGNEISPTFYGPTGQEIGATFQLRTGLSGDPNNVHIVGATVAKED